MVAAGTSSYAAGVGRYDPDGRPPDHAWSPCSGTMRCCARSSAVRRAASSSSRIACSHGRCQTNTPRRTRQ